MSHRLHAKRLVCVVLLVITASATGEAIWPALPNAWRAVELSSLPNVTENAVVRQRLPGGELLLSGGGLLPRLVEPWIGGAVRLYDGSTLPDSEGSVFVAGANADGFAAGQERYRVSTSLVGQRAMYWPADSASTSGRSGVVLPPLDTSGDTPSWVQRASFVDDAGRIYGYEILNSNFETRAVQWDTPQTPPQAIRPEPNAVTGSGSNFLLDAVSPNGHLAGGIRGSGWNSSIFRPGRRLAGDAQVTLLEPVGRWNTSSASDINPNGDTLGGTRPNFSRFQNADLVYHAFFWPNDRTTPDVLPGLGAFDAADGLPLAIDSEINGDGWMIGRAISPDDPVSSQADERRYEAVLWEPDQTVHRLSDYVHGLPEGSTTVLRGFGFNDDRSMVAELGRRSSPGSIYQKRDTVLLLPVTSDLLGDYDASGAVDQGDLDLVLSNWGRVLPGVAPTGWVNVRGVDATIDQNELDAVLSHWGASSAPLSVTGGVPEPGTAWIVLAGGLAWVGRKQAASQRSR